MVGNVTYLGSFKIFVMNSLEKLAQVFQVRVKHFQRDSFLTNEANTVVYDQLELILHELGSWGGLTREFVRLFHQVDQREESCGKQAVKTSAIESPGLKLQLRITIACLRKTMLF